MALAIVLAASVSGLVASDDLDKWFGRPKAGLPAYQANIGPLVAAHQGDAFANYPNTILAFEEARRAGADIVELDLRTSKDGVVVAFHDEWLTRRTLCRGRVRDSEFRKLRECAYTGTNEFMPTFEEVLVWSGGRTLINAEFKEFSAIRGAIELVRQYNAYEWVYFQAQNWEQYDLVRQSDNMILLSFAPKNNEELDRVLATNDPRLSVVELHANIRTKENIDRIHAAGKYVSENSWHFTTLHELGGAACTQAFMFDIDIAVTNRPKECVRQRNDFKKSGRAAPANAPSAYDKHPSY